MFLARILAGGFLINIPTNLWNLALLTGSVICDPRMLFQIMTSIMILKNQVHKRIGEARMIVTQISRIKWPQNRSHYWVSKQNRRVSSMLAFNSRYDELHKQMGKFLMVQNFRNLKKLQFLIDGCWVQILIFFSTLQQLQSETISNR